MTLFVWPVRVYYEDTDAVGVVYHANYLKFLERARTEWLRSLGIELDELTRREGVIFVIRAINVEFIRVARFNQMLAVDVSVSSANRVAFEVRQRILLQNGDSTSMAENADSVLCTATVKVVALDAATLRPKRMPNSIYAEISRGNGN